jgi:formyltetrahydrofolate synthetase
VGKRHGGFIISAPTIWYPAGPQQNIAVGAASVAATAFGVETTTIRLASTTNCFVLIAPVSTPVTTANGFYLPLGRAEYFRVPTNGVLTVIQATAGGTLSVTEVTR